MRECVFLFNLDAIVQDKNSKKNSRETLIN